MFLHLQLHNGSDILAAADLYRLCRRATSSIHTTTESCIVLAFHARTIPDPDSVPVGGDNASKFCLSTALKNPEAEGACALGILISPKHLRNFSPGVQQHLQESMNITLH